VVEEVSPELVAVKVYPLPILSIESPLKVAKPFTALKVVVPDNLAPAVPEPGVIDSVTEAPDGIGLPSDTDNTPLTHSGAISGVFWYGRRRQWCQMPPLFI
jgi:hypothetical protein